MATRQFTPGSSMTVGGALSYSGVQTFNAAITAASTLTANAGLTFQPGGTGNTFTISAATPAANRTYTLPDAGTTAEIVLTEGSRTIAGDTVFVNDVDISGELLVVGDTTTTGNLTAFGYGTTVNQTNTAIPTGTLNLFSPYTVGWRFSIPLGIKFLTVKSATNTWAGGGTTRNFRIYDSVGTLLTSATISNADPVINGMYVHTLSTPLEVPAGTYTVATDRLNGDGLRDTVTINSFITEIVRAYAVVYGYPNPSGPYFTNAIDAFFDFQIQGPVVGALSSVATFSNGIDLQLDGYGAKYTLSYTRPTASRTYTMTDAGANCDFVMTAGAQSIAGDKTLVDNLTCSKGIYLPTATAGGDGIIYQNGARLLHTWNISNVYVGQSGNLTQSPTTQTALGYNALVNVQTGASKNVAIGAEACTALTTGVNCTGIGRSALIANTIGTDNIGIGYLAGSAITTTSGNIFIGNIGVAGDAATIKIGTSHTSCAIAGISGRTSSAGVAVLVNASGVLGTTTSSIRFKENVKTVDNEVSTKINNLRIVEFNYKKDSEKRIQYGVIAEEAAEHFPELIAYDNDDPTQPINTIQYHLLVPLLIKELQVLRARVEQLENK